MYEFVALIQHTLMEIKADRTATLNASTIFRRKLAAVDLFQECVVIDCIFG